MTQIGPHNHFLQFAHPDIPLPVTTDQVVTNGMLVYWDAAAYTIKPMASATDAQKKFVGVSLQDTPFAVYSEDGYQRSLMVRRSGIFMFKTTDGQVYAPGDPVKVGADARTVSKASVTVNTMQVGVVVLRPPEAPRENLATPVPESITGGAGIEVPVLITPHWPTILA